MLPSAHRVPRRIAALALVLVAGSSSSPHGAVGRAAGDALQTRTVPAGTRMTVRVPDSVSTRTSRAGQSFAATVTSPVELPEGVAVPRGASLHFTVLRLAPSRAAWEPTRLTIVFDSLVARGAARPVSADWIRPGSVIVRSSPIGALTGVLLLALASAAGWFVGRRVGSEGGGGGLTGAALAAVAAAVAITVFQRVHATIPAGSELEVRLRAPVELPAPPPEG